MLLSGCGNKDPALFVTLTLKRDGSRFSGKVVRREPNSITVTGQGGDTHTFLWNELSLIEYGAPSRPAGPSGPTGTSGSTTDAGTTRPGPASTPGELLRVTDKATESRGSTGDVIRLPAGTVLPIAATTVIDSSFFPLDVALGAVDSDVKAADGKVLIPQGANVTIVLRDQKVVSGRIEMDLEVASADFNNRHYVVSSAKDGVEPGAVLTLTGAQPGTQEAKLQGLGIHVANDSLMMFKAENPTFLKEPR